MNKLATNVVFLIFLSSKVTHGKNSFVDIADNEDVKSKQESDSNIQNTKVDC